MLVALAIAAMGKDDEPRNKVRFFVKAVRDDMYWDEFNCEEKVIADEWDGHTEKDVIDRLHYSNIVKHE